MTKLFNQCPERTIGRARAVTSAPIDSACPQAGLPLLQGGGNYPPYSQPSVAGGTADEAMPRRRTRAVPLGGRLPRRAPARAAIESAMGAGMFRAFRQDRRGSVAVETAISVSPLLIVQIVHSAHVSDRMGRAAHAAPRAIPLSREADDAAQAIRACEPVRDELGPDGDFDCKAGLALSIRNLLPATLPRGPVSDAEDPDGQLVAVRVAWNTGPWNPGKILTDDDEDTRRGAIGIARLEPPKGG